MAGKPTRLIMGYQGKQYKLLYYKFACGDGSFIFQLYRKPGDPPCVNPMTIKPGIETPIDFDAFEPAEYQEAHVSFHASGKIHSKSRDDVYHNRQDGIPFDTIREQLWLLAVAPVRPDNLVPLKGDVDNRRDIHLHLPENVEPFIIHLGVFRPGIEPQLNGESLLGGIITMKSDTSPFGIMIGMTAVQKTPECRIANWPPRTLQFKRLG